MTPGARRAVAMARTPPESAQGVALQLLCIVGELLRGGRYNRHSIARMSYRSVQTADRWIKAIVETIPGAKLVRIGKTTWIEVQR